LHVSAVQFLNYALPSNIIAFHPANGGARSKATAGQMKAMGVRKGIPDLGIILPTGMVAWIEFKVGRGRLTPEQAEFRDLMRARGVPFAECRSLAEVEAFVAPLVEAFGGRMKARAA